MAAPGVRKIAGSAMAPVNARTASQTRAVRSRMGMWETSPKTVPMARIPASPQRRCTGHGGHDERADTDQLHARIQTLQETAGGGQILGEEDLFGGLQQTAGSLFDETFAAAASHGRRAPGQQ